MKKILKLETCTMDEISRLFGRQEENIRLLEEAMQCELIVRGDEIVMDNTEEKNQQVEDMIRTLLALVKQGKTISQRDIMYSLNLAKNHQLNMIDELYQIKIARTTNGKLIYPKTLGQKEYYQALKHNDVVFGTYKYEFSAEYLCHISQSSKFSKFSSIPPYFSNIAFSNITA